MWSPRHVLVTLFLCLLAGSLLFGCRAFEPEAVIVNKAPETYIIGSPAETSGAYFHFHVYWYGTDGDGFVERYVWALTDTSTQDPETDDDEEDLRFNPATNISTLDIGRWTTRTDSVFDFQINQGANLSTHMTLHMVAMDDRGDFDRTPARLHFFSNALGNPELQFYRNEIAAGNEFADYDTIAYGEPLLLRWAGSTPNVAAYDPALLAVRDTVPPVDGLLGYKWRLPDLFSCNDAQEDCWNPKDFDEATGDSFSFFGDGVALNFLNDGSGDGVFSRKLNAQTITLLVNTLDVAGVEVPSLDQELHIVVNYDPDTYILRGESGGPNDPGNVIYPYYTVFHGPEADTYTFAEGDTVPDRAYVVFKALGWDDPRDEIVNTASNDLSFQGQFVAGQYMRIDGVYFEFFTSYSDTHQTPEWTDPDPTRASADTLGFQVGPFNYDVVMRAVDEQGTRDGTPDTFSFVGNYPPCVQCIELTNFEHDPVYTFDDPCWNSDCFDEVTDLKVYKSGSDVRYDPVNDPTILSLSPATSGMWINPDAGVMTFNEPLQPAGFTFLDATHYAYIVYLEGKDHPREHWTGNRVKDRVMGWKYQIDYEGDFGNSIQDGGGSDNIAFLSGYNVEDFSHPTDPLLTDMYIDPDTGVWVLRVTVAVPNLLLNVDAWWNYIRLRFGAMSTPADNTEEAILAWQELPEVQRAYRAWKLSLMQYTPGTVSAIAADQSTCTYRKETNAYHYYNGTRVPNPNGRKCTAKAYEDGEHEEKGMLDLEVFTAFSDDRNPTVKDFTLSLYLPGSDEPITGEIDPPGWISTDGKQANWR